MVSANGCLDGATALIEALRQRMYPREFRIAAPGMRFDIPTFAKGEDGGEGTSAGDEEAACADPAPRDTASDEKMVAELATCLWYLRTKHLKRQWQDTEQASEEDPRVRRALRSIDRGLSALCDHEVEIQDFTNRRFVSGGEAFMKPLDFTPVAGLSVERVAETVKPAVFLCGRLIQRGEVFVEVPMTGGAAGREPDTGQGLEATAGGLEAGGRRDTDRGTIGGGGASAVAGGMNSHEQIND